MDDSAPTRYRRVALALWGDEKFRDLSPQLPSGQTLWIYLLTGPHTTSVPGLSHAGEATLAERLGWPLRAFRRCFGELRDNEMLRADPRSGLLWIAKALNYNAPANPNVVRGWREPVAVLPSCPLKTEALQALREHCAARGERFLQAFDESFGKANGKRFTGPLSQPLPEPLAEQLPKQYANTGSGTGSGTRTREEQADAHAPARSSRARVSERQQLVERTRPRIQNAGDPVPLWDWQFAKFRDALRPRFGDEAFVETLRWITRVGEELLAAGAAVDISDPVKWWDARYGTDWAPQPDPEAAFRAEFLKLATKGVRA